MKYEIIKAQSLEEQKKADDERWRLQIAEIQERKSLDYKRAGILMWCILASMLTLWTLVILFKTRSHLMSKNQGPRKLGGNSKTRGAQSIIAPEDLPRLTLHAMSRYSASGLYTPGDTLAPRIVAAMKGKLA